LRSILQVDWRQPQPWGGWYVPHIPVLLWQIRLCVPTLGLETPPHPVHCIITVRVRVRVGSVLSAALGLSIGLYPSVLAAYCGCGEREWAHVGGGVASSGRIVLLCGCASLLVTHRGALLGVHTVDGCGCGCRCAGVRVAMRMSGCRMVGVCVVSMLEGARRR